MISSAVLGSMNPRSAMQKLRLPGATTVLQAAFPAALKALCGAPERQAVYMLRILRAALTHALALLASETTQLADFLSPALTGIHHLHKATEVTAQDRKPKAALAMLTSVNLAETPRSTSGGGGVSLATGAIAKQSSTGPCCPMQSKVSKAANVNTDFVTRDHAGEACSASPLLSQSGEALSRDLEAETVSAEPVAQATKCDKFNTQNLTQPTTKVDSQRSTGSKSCSPSAVSKGKGYEQHPLPQKGRQNGAKSVSDTREGLPQESQQFLAFFSALVEAALKWYAGV